MASSRRPPWGFLTRFYRGPRDQQVPCLLDGEKIRPFPGHDVAQSDLRGGLLVWMRSSLPVCGRKALFAWRWPRHSGPRRPLLECRRASSNSCPINIPMSVSRRCVPPNERGPSRSAPHRSWYCLRKAPGVRPARSLNSDMKRPRHVNPDRRATSNTGTSVDASRRRRSGAGECSRAAVG